MDLKKLVSLILCVFLLLSVSACKNADSLSSDYSSDSDVTEIYQEVEIVEDDDNDGSSSKTDNNSSDDTQSDSTDEDEESDEDDEENLSMEEKYGFTSLKTAEFYCVKDIPYGDAEYEVTGVITDKGSDVYYMCDIISKNPQITIDGKKIYVPYDFKKENDSVTLSVCHWVSGLTIDFTITFDTWELIFEDNFDGIKLNTDVWNIWDSADWQYFYSPDAVFLDGKGHLVNRVSILETADSEYGYTRQSGAITTKDKYESTYGYYEISAKLHRTTGLWGAFWIMAGDMGDKDAVNDGSAVNGCEIDVVESIYNTKIPSHAIHWDGYYNDQTKSQGFYSTLKPRPEVFDDNFHTFAVRWSGDEYVFYVDGEITARADIMGSCNQPAYMLISSHFGDWGGEVVMEPGEYTDMVVDYVRVYQSSSDPV